LKRWKSRATLTARGNHSQTTHKCAGYPLIQNGDVHYLDDYLGATAMDTLEAPTIAELRLAFELSTMARSFIAPFDRRLPPKFAPGVLL
jgi:hypothetical protein